MENKNIFIHIPKTGGTTINTAMHNVYWQTDIDFNYRHIDIKTKKSTCGDIFDDANSRKYSDYTIFTMLREPVDRIISEYHFLRERKEFINLLNRPPQNLNDYYKNRQTQNYMTGFLVGKRIYDKNPATEQDLIRVINAIDSLPIHVGIFEYFSESMGYFTTSTGIEWNKKLTAKRMTFNRPNVSEIDPEIQEEILSLNSLDAELYQHCLKKFHPLIQKHKKNNVQFELNKYHHIYPYMAKTCLFEFCLENKHYIKQNFLFFKDLTFYLIKDLEIKDGEQLVKMWNQAVLNSIADAFPSSEFYQKVISAHGSSTEPLQQLINLGEGINDFLKKDPKASKKFYKAMKFDENLVTEAVTEKKGFMSKLFGMS